MARRFYRLLLRFCPPDLRAEFGAQMEALFLAELARASGLGKIRVWMGALVDVLRHGLGARNDAWNRLRGTSAYVEYDRRGFWMDTWRYDLRYAARTMMRQPGTAAMVVFTLALAIGANTAVFSATYSVLLRPLPYAQPENLVALYEKRPAEGVLDNSVSPADFVDWARLNQSFTAIAAMSYDAADLTGDFEPEKLEIAAVSAAYFDVFGVRAVHGRTFAAGEDVLGRHRVVVLTHALWQQRFGGDPGIVGRKIALNDISQEVIGVLPADVRFPATDAQLFAPMVLQGGPEPLPRASHFLSVYGRLKPGVAFERAREEMDRIGRDLEQQYPQMSRGHGSHVERLDQDLAKTVRQTLIVLMASVVFILLIACINVTNLLLARTAGRRRELAVRAAIGAGRARLARQIIVETGVLVAGGAAAALVVALWGVQLLATQLPPVSRPDVAIVFSMPVLLFTLVVSVASTLMVGVLPALQLIRDDPSESLKEGGRSPVALRRKLRFGLIVTEVALTSLLLVGAGLTIRSFQKVLSLEPGIQMAGRLTFNVTVPRSRYPDEAAIRRFFSDLESRLASEPGVTSVGATINLPLSPSDGRRGVVIQDRIVGPDDGPTRAHPRLVTSDYLVAVGARIREGRGFLPSDREGAPAVTIVNETMARRYWPNRSAIGGRVRFTDQEVWREVVGIVGDVRHWGLDAPVNPEMYVPVRQFPARSMTFVMATAGDPVSLVPMVRRHLKELDANLPLSAVRTLDQVAARSIERRRFTMTLLGSFAVLALVLAMAGIYGVMAHLISLRTPEIGIRLTLGARPSGVMAGVLGEGAMQAAIGLVIGLGASLAAMRGLQTILFGVEPTDAVTLAAVAAALMVVALLAVALPAYRAMQVDPVAALRAE